MLRPAIVANMKKYPRKDHVLHIRSSEAPMFSDIEGLKIVPIDGKSTLLRQRSSSKELAKYGKHTLHGLSTPCSVYESENLPYIIKSRQEIFCETVGVKFNYKNYSVSFTEEELDFANDFLFGCGGCIGIHLRSAEPWRDFRYVNIKKNKIRMFNVVEMLASKFDGYIVTFDGDKKYEGKAKNVISMASEGIRLKWAVASNMLLGIGPDSAYVHMFGATNVPVYGIFGPTDPKVRLRYPNSYYSPPYKKCKSQYCWYLYPRCRHNIGCMNSRTSVFYVRDILRKMGRFI